MNTANPLIAQAHGGPQWFSGIGAIEGLDALISGLDSGNWIEAGLGLFGTGMEVLSASWDPIGTLLRWAASWVMEHLEPLRRMLDQLGGNPPVIEAYAATWTNVSNALSSTAGDIEGAVARDLVTWQGDAADAYRAQAAEKVTAMREAAKLVGTSGHQASMVSMLVGAVRTMVREAIAALVAWLVKSIGLTVLTGPFGATEAVRTAISEIARVTSMVTNTIAKLLRSLANLKGMIPGLVDAFDKVAGKLAPKAARVAEDAPGAVRPAGSVESAAARHAAEEAAQPHTPPREQPGGDAPTSPSGSAPHDGPAGAPRNGEAPKGEGTHPSSEEGGGGQRSEGNRGTRETRGGDPVDAVSGQMVTSATDADLPGLLPLVLRRAYASDYRQGRLHGPGWSSTVDQRVEVTADAVGYIGEDAEILRYRRADRVGEPVMPAGGARWPLSWDGAEDTYRIEDPATGLVRHFGPNPAGPGVRPITALSDRNGNRITFARSPDGAPVEVSHSGGYRIRVDTADTGGGLRIAALRLLADSGAEVTLAEYRYDGRGRLTEIVNPTGVPYRYSHDEADRITGWTDRENYRYSYEYRADGRVARGTGEGGYLSAEFDYDLTNRITTVTDSLGGATAYHYDEHDHLTRIVDPLGNAESTVYDRYHRLLARTDPLGHTTRYTRDADGLAVRVEQPDGTVTTASYNGFQQPVEIVGPDGARWRYAYDERGNLRAETDPAGAVTSYTYDAHGEPRLIVDALGQITSVTTNAAGLALSVTDPSGAGVGYTVDERGRIVAVTDPLGAVTATEWGAADLPSRRVYPDGTAQTWRHDANGDLVELTERTGHATRFEIGPFHLVTARTDPDGTRHAFAHDTELRLTEVVNPQGLRWRYTYDAAANLVGERDFNGRALGYTYDAAGRLARLTNGAGQTVTVAHDALGRITARHTGDGATAFDYDPAGRLVGAVGPDAELRWTRDPLGRLLTETVNGRTLTCSYDPLGRRVSRTTPTGYTSTWRYDSAGRPSELTSGGRRITFGHDAAGQEIHRWFGPNVALNSSWDAMGRLTARQLVAVDTAEGGRAAQVRHSRAWTYRADDIPDSVTDGTDGTRRFDLDPLGRVTAVRAAAWTERYAYDASGNLTFADDTRAAGSAVAGPRSIDGTLLRRAGHTHFDHDAQGRLVRTVRTTPSGARQTWLYRYDAGDRLTEVVNPAGQRWRYRYDPLGRRIGKQLLGQNGTPAEEIRFTWDGDVLAEQEHLRTGAPVVTATTWDHEPGNWSPVSQDRRTFAARAPQRVVDRQFHAIITDLVGTPTELVTADGRIDWRRQAGLWGNEYRAAGPPGMDCLLRFPGQYHDYETGLDYNLHRYYDPETGRFTAADPIGLAPAPNPYAYVTNPSAYLDPLGLISDSRLARLDRPGWTNYVLKDATGKIYYSGIFGPTADAATTETRHAANHNRFTPPDPANPAAPHDTLEPVAGKRTYGEARLMEQELARQHGTVVGREGDNYRGNRERPMDPKRTAEYQEYERLKKTGSGCG